MGIMHDPRIFVSEAMHRTRLQEAKDPNNAGRLEIKGVPKGMAARCARRLSAGEAGLGSNPGYLQSPPGDQNKSTRTRRAGLFCMASPRGFEPLLPP